MKNEYELRDEIRQCEHDNEMFAGILALVAVGVLAVAPFYFESQDRKALEKYADINKDGIVSTNEWRNVYDELRLSYNPTNRVQLTSKQVGEYLDNHDPVRIERNKAEAAHRMLMGHSVPGFR